MYVISVQKQLTSYSVVPNKYQRGNQACVFVHPKDCIAISTIQEENLILLMQNTFNMIILLFFILKHFLIKQNQAKAFVVVLCS